VTTRMCDRFVDLVYRAANSTRLNRAFPKLCRWVRARVFMRAYRTAKLRPKDVDLASGPDATYVVWRWNDHNIEVVSIANVKALAKTDLGPGGGRQ